MPLHHAPAHLSVDVRPLRARNRLDSRGRHTAPRHRSTVSRALAALIMILLISAVLADATPRTFTPSLDPASSFAEIASGGDVAWQGDAAAPQPTIELPVHAAAMARTVPATIASDCSKDVTTALNAWMASVADGSTLHFRAGDCYRVDGTLMLRDRHDLTVDGNGALFAASVVPPASPKITRQMWSVVGGDGITIRNMGIRGTNPTATFDVRREWFPLIQIAGSRQVLIDGVRGSNAWGDFVSIGPDTRRVTRSNGTGAVMPKNVLVRRSSATVIGRHGVTCNGCENIRVDGNVFRNVAYQIFDIEVEADTWYARNVAFTNNTIGGRVKLSVLANAGMGRDVTNITVRGNVMTSTPVTCAPPIQVDDTAAVKSNFVLTNNRFKTLGNAFWLRGVSDVTVADNAVTFENGGCRNAGVAVFATSGHGIAITNNDFSGARRLVQVGTTATVTACGNRLSGSGFDQPQPCGAT
jgi:hypothetical protein